MKAVILAAGLGTRMGSLTLNCPKPLLEIEGKSLLQRSLENLKKKRVNDVIIVVGYMKEMIKKKKMETLDGMKITYVTNKNYETTSTVGSLYLTKELVNEDALILEGDILYEPNAIKWVLEEKKKDVILTAPLSGSEDEAYIYADKENNLIDVKRELRNKDGVLGELVGIVKISKESLKMLYDIAGKEIEKGINDRFYEDAILNLSKITPIKCLLKDVLWVGVNNEDDLILARKEIFLKIQNRLKKK